jgi:transposase
MAAVALAHGLNANLLRRWVIEQDRTDAATNIQETMPLLAAGEFVPLQLTSPSNAASDIRVEVRRGATTVTASWPAQESSACAAWLREWLK